MTKKLIAMIKVITKFSHFTALVHTKQNHHNYCSTFSHVIPAVHTSHNKVKALKALVSTQCMQRKSPTRLILHDLPNESSEERWSTSHAGCPQPVLYSNSKQLKYVFEIHLLYSAFCITTECTDELTATTLCSRLTIKSAE